MRDLLHQLALRLGLNLLTFLLILPALLILATFRPFEAMLPYLVHHPCQSARIELALDCCLVGLLTGFPAAVFVHRYARSRRQQPLPISGWEWGVVPALLLLGTATSLSRHPALGCWVLSGVAPGDDLGLSAILFRLPAFLTLGFALGGLWFRQRQSSSALTQPNSLT